jgi:anti-repressor protein
MYDLIKITETEKGQVVSARDLHAFLIKEAKGGQTGEMFSHWIKRCLDFGFEENHDYSIINYNYLGIVINSKSDNQRISKRDYVLTLECAKQIAMLQNNDKGKQARRYFIECEKIAKDMLEINPPKKLPQNYSEALRELADKNDAIVLLEERNKTLEPRSRYFEQIVLTDGLISMEQTAKLLNIKDMGRNNLFKALREANVIQKNNTSPLQYYIDKGYFELKEEIVIIKNIRKVIVTTLVTQKGLAFLFKFFNLTEKNLS